MKTFFKHLLIQVSILITLGVSYAAWNDIVNSGDPLTATGWNELVTKVADLDNFSFSGENVGIGNTSPNNLLHVAGRIESDDILIGVGARQMLATNACMHASNTSGWVSAYKRGSYSSCNARCADTESIYYTQCRGMMSVRSYAENSGVNLGAWNSTSGCATTNYAGYDEFYCCCSY